MFQSDFTPKSSWVTQFSLNEFKGGEGRGRKRVMEGKGGSEVMETETLNWICKEVRVDLGEGGWEEINIKIHCMKFSKIFFFEKYFNIILKEGDIWWPWNREEGARKIQMCVCWGELTVSRTITNKPCRSLLPGICASSLPSTRSFSLFDANTREAVSI